MAATSYRQESTATTLEDLAPNLAKSLAIGRDGDDEGDDNKGDSLEDTKPPARPSGQHSAPPAARGDSSKKLKRIWNVYPGTTTSTSEEEDDNTYYSSRGASVCSVLLHTMVQIDERIPEGPQYSVVQIPADRNAQLKRKGPASCSGGNAAVVIHRGSFACTATLKLLKRPASPSSTSPNEKADNLPEAAKEYGEKGTETNENAGDEDGSSETKEAAEYIPEEQPPGEESTTLETSQVAVLEGVGQGSSKREAKHKASAQLLALLFPECKSMVEVKAAAEAAREKYAASKAKKQQQLNRDNGHTGNRRRSRREDSNSNRAAISLQTFGIAAPSDPPLPEHLRQELRGILGKRNRAPSVGSVASLLEKAGLSKDSSSSPPTSANAANDKENGDYSPSGDLASQDVHQSLGRQISRQKQLEDRVDSALQAFNEHDDEGRSLPDELTVDDVGRTVLRRAEPDDLDKVRKLFSASDEKFTELSDGPLSIIGAATVERADAGSSEGNSTENYNAGAQRLWCSSTFVLLLCRAIAPFEDPPMGCAVLTLGFSMERGPSIRIAQLASEPHLPRERFLECLEGFARCIDCHLETNLEAIHLSRRKIRLSREDLQRVLFSHLALDTAATTGSGGLLGMGSPAAAPARRGNISSLQSVLEESEGGDETDRSAEVAARQSKARDKPSKRTRVE